MESGELSITYCWNPLRSGLKSWYDFVAEVEDDSLTGYLLKGDAPGRVSCHSVNDTGAIEIAWKAGGRGAISCINTTTSRLKCLGTRLSVRYMSQDRFNCRLWGSFKQNDPSIFKSNFVPIKKATCVECHNEQLAGKIVALVTNTMKMLASRL